MRRVFVPNGSVKGDRVDLPGTEAHYVRRVLRLGPGDRFSAVLPGGVERVATILGIGGGEVEASLGEEVSRQADPAVDVRLFAGLLKAAKFELVVQKCTELGVSAITPVVCRRSISRAGAGDQEKKVGRWRRIAAEAARQCGRTVPPTVHGPVAFSQAVSEAAQSGGLCLVMSPDAGGEIGSGAALAAREPERPVVVLVGPEGGFAPEELEEAEAAGFQAVSLGTRTLRAETAAIVACALVMYEAGELR